MDLPLLRGQAISFARVEINHDPSATTLLGGRMDARSVWFRETGEGRPKEQLLIETMFCVYYLGKGIAARCVSHVRRALRPPFPDRCAERGAPPSQSALSSRASSTRR